MSLPHLDAVSNGSHTDSVLSNGWPADWIADDPDAAATSPEAVCEAAQRYVAAGLSCIPIDAEEPSKSPDPRRVRSWKIYQLRRPRDGEIQSWLDLGGSFGLAVIGGEVSGGQRGHGLEIIDFDSITLATPWMDRVEARVPGLVARLVRVQSPRPGWHVYFRCSTFGECQKLACAPAVDCNGVTVLDEHGKLKKATLIELKGNGGYCLVPPSPRRCHPRNQLYRLIEGSPDFTQIPVITPEERDILLTEARSFNRWTEAEPQYPRPAKSVNRGDSNLPGHDFERRANWADILLPHGWTPVGHRGDTDDWRRPGKSDGSSATTNYGGSGFLYVFSTDAYPFVEKKPYSKFATYTLLNHDGDFKKSADTLRKEGYGRQGLPAGKRPSMSQTYTTKLRLNQ